MSGKPVSLKKRMNAMAGKGWSRRGLAGILAPLLVVSMIGQQPAAAEPAKWDPPKPKDVAGVAVQNASPATSKSQHAQSNVVTGAKKVAWPQGTATADLAAAQQAASKAIGTRAGLTGPVRARAGQLPVAISEPVVGGLDTASRSLTAVSHASVTVHDRKATQNAGVTGILASIVRDDGTTTRGPASLQVAYDSFADAFGGDWASRLRLVQVPACALTTPQAPSCQTRTPLPTDNDTANRTLTANVMVGSAEPLVVAAEATASGDSGDYSATSLSPAGQWQVSAQTGAFSWSYPMRMPPALGGPVPSVSLAYSSGSVDGRTALTNNQGSWIGDGWDFWPGFIERKYASCSDDNPAHKTGDQCWYSSNATLSMNGHAGELIETSTANVWRLRNDDGTRIERLTDAARGNGDNDNEYWKVTTTDGMQYFFGYHKLPGWTAGNETTDSVWTAPVYGNNSGEPCYNATFASAHCAQGWRWNLDYVVDPDSNTMAYFYEAETGAYGRDNTPSQRTTYHRGGYLEHIDYGMRKDAEYSQAAPLKVVFETKERCLAGCWTGTAWTSDPVASEWDDSPWDQYCKTAPCTTQLSPTFWTARRFAKVTTQVRNGATSYQNVESLTLRHEFVNAGSGEATPMWLRGITRAGHVTTAGGVEVTDPEITFDTGAESLPNRVDGPADGLTGLNRYRIKAVHNESGGDITVTYSGHDCTRTTLPAPESNTKRCFPSFYAPTGEPVLDWFHKYVVDRIQLVDNTGGGQPAEITSYAYLDSPAWAYNNDELTKDKHRTWGDWRGYGRVQVRHGDPAGQQTAVEHRYLRGMDGDKQPSGVRDVWVSDTWGGTIEDSEALNGYQLQQITLNGPAGAEISSTRSTPWINGPTATRTRNNITTKAWMTKTSTARQRSAVTGGAHRYTKQVTTFNNDGFALTSEDQGDENVTGDETCDRTTYARNDAAWMIDRIAQTETLSGLCAGAATPANPATVLNRSRSFYDTYTGEASFGQPPGRGNVVRSEELESFNGSTPVYSRTATTGYDSNGRVTSTLDAGDTNPTTTAYTTANGGLVTATTVTNPKGHAASTVNEPAWVLPKKITAENGTITELTYDGLGRLTAVWLPGRNKATQNPSAKFSYLTRNTGGPTAVTTERLLPTGTTYKKTVDLYDGWLRPRQQQEQATGGGRLLTDTFYNAIGETAWASLPYYDSTNTAPGTSLGVPQGQIPAVTEYTYDGAGRVITETLKANGIAKWNTTAAYSGDRTTVTPPAGGTATTTIVDAKGQSIQLRQYKNRADAGSDDPLKFDKTTYSYTLLGQQKTITDVTGLNVWSFAYDLRGRQTQSTDPDKGVSTTTYDNAGNVQTVTGPLGGGTATVAYTYDELGRKTSLRDDTTTGTVRAQWVYDTLPNGTGKLTSATRYDGSNAYTVKTDTFDQYGRPTSTSVVLPATEANLCAAPAPNTCTYTTITSYKANGQPFQITSPAVADLPQEKLTYGYNDVGNSGSLLSAAQIYVDTATYSKLGQLTGRLMGAFGTRVQTASTFDEPTRRVTGMNVVPELKPEAANYGYTYDDAGNFTKITDAPTGATSDTQCFTVDYLRRLTEAWTPETGNCTAAPTAWSQIDGAPAPYWHTWTIDPNGNRKSEVRHGSTNATYNYTYPAAGSPRPHAVTNVAATGAVTWSRNYTYDNAGNTKTRPTSTGATQTLAFDREGKVASTVDGATTNPTSYLYDADGNRLTRTDATGKTLYLPGGTEIRYTTTGATKKATRYYTHAGQTIAIRTATSLDWIITDHHGTAELTIKASDLTVAKRRNLPYGEQRGTTTGTWAAGLDKGFVGGTQDPNGLTHLGARQYDPFTGKFVSVDPLVDPGDPQTLNAYSYSNNNPATYSDPTGLAWGWKEWVTAAVVVIAVVVVVAVVAYTCPYVLPALINAGSAALEAGAFAAASGAGTGAAATVAGGAAAAEVSIAVAGSSTVAATVGTAGVATAAGAGLVGRTLTGGSGGGPTISAGGIRGVIGAKWSTGTPDDPIASPFVPLHGTNKKPGEPTQLTDRGSWWKATLNNSWNQAANGPDGGKLCPTQGPSCAGTVHVPPNTGVPRDWDNSHNPSWFNRLFAPWITRKQVNSNYNTDTFLECVPCNRGGKANDSRFNRHGEMTDL